MGAAEQKVAAFLRAGVVAAVAGVLRDGGGQPVEATAEAIVDLFDREAVQPLAAEVERLQGVADSAQEDATSARTDGYVDALRWVLADLEANRACSAYAFIRDFRARLSAIENGVEKP